MENENRKNVLQLMNYNAPYKGNFIQSILCLETKLKAENIEMIYLFEKETAAREWARELIDEGKKIYFLKGSNIKDIFFINSLIRKHKIGIIHTHFIGIRYNFLLNIVRRFLGKRLTIARHFHNPYDQKSNVAEKVKKIFAPVDITIACSKAVADDYALKKKDKNERIEYATNAIDFSRLDKYETLQKENLGMEKDSFTLLLFGFDYYRKGVDLTMDAVYGLIKQDINLYLLISLAVNKNFAEQEIRRKFNEIPKWIKIIEPRDDIATYYKFADVFISSSRSEGFCYSLVEAAYCGNQIIASEILAQQDLNIPYTFQFPSGNVGELKKQILLSMATSADEKIRRANEQKKYVTRTFDLNLWAEEVIRIYKSVS